MPKDGQRNFDVNHAAARTQANAPTPLQNASPTDDWSANFFKRLRTCENELQTEIDDMLGAIHRNRRSKPPLQW